MNNRQRIGVFGGSFDPIHSAHCAIARAAMRQAGLDRVLFVVAPRPPHKDHGPVASPEDRYDMVCAALRNEDGMAASRLELDRPGKSYSVDTVRELQHLHPDAELFLILGMDSLLDLPRWKEPQEILAQAHILAVPRPNLERNDLNRTAELRGRYTVLDFQEDPVSSTEIRERIAAGKPWEHLVPPAVRDLIREKGLYHVHR